MPSFSWASLTLHNARCPHSSLFQPWHQVTYNYNHCLKSKKKIDRWTMILLRKLISIRSSRVAEVVFCGFPKICRDFCPFWKTLGKQKCSFWGQKQPDDNFCGHFCLRRNVSNFCFPGGRQNVHKTAGASDFQGLEFFPRCLLFFY